MKFQGIVNNRLALVMLVLSLVISFEITMKSFNESSTGSGTTEEIRNNCSTKTSNAQISASYILSSITKCFFAFLLGGVVNEFKFIKIGLI